MNDYRQKLLVLYLSNSTPSAEVIGWSSYDGSSKESFEAVGLTIQRPYSTCLDAMRDGWRVIRFPPLQNVTKGSEFDQGYLEYEFVLEKWEKQNAS